MFIPNAISAKEAALLIGVSEQRARYLLRSKSLDGRQIGKHWITTKEAVTKYMVQTQPKHPVDKPRVERTVPKIKALSFFSGAMGLDLGLEKAGFKILLACENDVACRHTIVANKPNIGLIGDLSEYTPDQVRKYAGLESHDEIDLIVGGPPCQAFSTAGTRRGFKDERGNIFLNYIDLILDLKPRYAVIENVRGLLSAPLHHLPHAKRGNSWKPTPDEMPGGALFKIVNKLRESGYGVSFNLYNAANFGVPQSRERVVIICNRDGEKVPHLIPTHSKDGSYGLNKWVTLRDALHGLDPDSGDHFEFPSERLKYYRLLKSGQNWKNLPVDLQKKALGNSYNAGGGKTGFLRRLSWDKPSCTLVTSPCMPATDICHPDKDRPLSVQEYKRIQQFPDDWQVHGTLSEQYRQIGNAVPVGLGEAIGNAIYAHMSGINVIPIKCFKYSRYKNTDEISWERETLKMMGLDSNEHISNRMNTNEEQLCLFESESDDGAVLTRSK